MNSLIYLQTIIILGVLKLQSIKLPPATSNEDSTGLTDLNFAKLFGVFQQEAFVLLDVKREGFHYGFDGFEHRNEVSQAIFERVVKEIGIEKVVNFLFQAFFTTVLENEVKYIKLKSQSITSLLKNYDQRELGYAISISRSEDGLTEEEVNNLILTNTSFSIEQYEDIKEKATSMPLTDRGFDEFMKMMSGAFGGDKNANNDSESCDNCGGHH